MITLEMNVIPYGTRLCGEHPVVRAEIWSEGRYHVYDLDVVDIEGPRQRAATFYGKVAKERSGHRNPLHLLKAIMADIDLTEVGINYARIGADVGDTAWAEHEKRLEEAESDRLRQLVEHGRQVFGSEGAARAFLERPHPGLDDLTPTDFVRRFTAGDVLVRHLMNESVRSGAEAANQSPSQTP